MSRKYFKIVNKSGDGATILVPDPQGKFSANKLSWTEMKEKFVIEGNKAYLNEDEQAKIDKAHELINDLVILSFRMNKSADLDKLVTTESCGEKLSKASELLGVSTSEILELVQNRIWRTIKSMRSGVDRKEKVFIPKPVAATNKLGDFKGAEKLKSLKLD